MGVEDYYLKQFLKLFFRDAEVITEADVPSGNLRIDSLFIKEKGVELPPPLSFGKNYSVMVGEYKSYLDIFFSQTITSLLVKGLLLLDTALKGKFLERKKNRKLKSPDLRIGKKGHEKTNEQKEKKRSKEKFSPRAKSILANSLRSSDYCLVLFLGGSHRLDQRVMEPFTGFDQNTCMKAIFPGVYRVFYGNDENSCGLSLDFYVVVFEELPDEPEFLAFKFFSNPIRREEIIRKAILGNDEFIYTLALYFNSELVISLEKTLNVRVTPTPESIRRGVEILGLEKVIEAVGAEKVIEAVGAEKVIEAVGAEKVIEMLGVEKTIQYFVSHPEAIKRLPPHIKKKLRRLLE